MYRKEEPQSEFKERLVSLNRVTKVVKGGKNFRFAALVVVGDEKASESAKKHLVNVAMTGTTIPHRIDGLYGTAKVVLIPAEEGAGVIAGGGARAVLELAGVKDIRTKTFGTSNRINTVKATIDGLSRLRDAETVAKMRGKTVEEILG